MTRAALLRWAAVLGGVLLCTELVLAHVPASNLLPFFFLSLSCILILDERDGALAGLLCLVCCGYLLWAVPPNNRPIAPLAFVLVESWFVATLALVWVLALRLRRQVRALARAAENVLPQPGRITGGLDGGHPGPQHLYARLLDSAPYGVVVVDEAGHIVFFSAQAETLFGYRREDVLGEMVEILLPDGLRERHQAHRATYLAAPQTRPMGADLDLVARRHDGTEFPIEVSLAPVETQQGGHRAVLVKAAVHDISARKALDAQLLEAQVQRAVAEQQVQERDQFLGTMAHEIRTPLASISGNAELLEAVLAGVTLEKTKQDRATHVLSAIIGQTARLDRLIDQLLDTTRIQAGRLLLDRHPTDVGALVRSVVAEMSLQKQNGYAATATAITLDLPQTPLMADIDPLRIEQVLRNLLSNAQKFSPSPQPGDITVTARRRDGTLYVAVRDHGIGVPPEYRTVLFTRFGQAHAQSFRSSLGLGLFVSREIITLHGGQIEADFPPDGGSLFSFTVPLGTPEPD